MIWHVGMSIDIRSIADKFLAKLKFWVHYMLCVCRFFARTNIHLCIQTIWARLTKYLIAAITRLQRSRSCRRANILDIRG